MTDQQLDDIFDLLDDLLLKNQYGTVNTLLTCVLESTDLALITGYLTITNTAREHLPIWDCLEKRRCRCQLENPGEGATYIRLGKAHPGFGFYWLGEFYVVLGGDSRKVQASDVTCIHPISGEIVNFDAGDEVNINTKEMK